MDHLVAKNSDVLFSDMELLRDNTLKSLKNNPEKFNSNTVLLSDDKQCRYRLGRGGQELVTDCFYQCVGCKLVAQMLDIDDTALDTPFEIEFGRYSGRVLVIARYGNVYITTKIRRIGNKHYIYSDPFINVPLLKGSLYMTPLAMAH